MDWVELVLPSGLPSGRGRPERRETNLWSLFFEGSHWGQCFWAGMTCDMWLAGKSKTNTDWAITVTLLGNP